MNLINIVYAGVLDDAPTISSLIVSAVNVILTFAGAVAVIVIVAAGVMYTTSGGNEQRVQFAKRALVGGIIGFAVVLSALMIVKIFVELV